MRSHIIRPSILSTVSLLLVVLASSGTWAAAQVPQSSTFFWEASTDGYSWTSEPVQVPVSLRSVQLRARVQIDPPATQDFSMCFGQTFFDGVIAFENGAGAGDVVDSFGREGLMHSAFGFAATRFGNVIKIDDPLDTALPGEGRGWIWPRQINPFVFGVIAIWDNPISVFSCRLVLDGSPGTRVVSARLGWSNTSVPPNHHVSAYSNAGNPVLNYVLPTPPHHRPLPRRLR